MTLRRLLSTLMLIPLLLLLSCEDEPEGRTSARFVYYVNGEAGATGEYHRYVIEEDRDETFATQAVMAMTEVAVNGRVLYMTRQSGISLLYGRCESGQIVPVPMPVSSDPGEEYLLFDSAPVLAYEGHHAAFLATRRPVGNSDSTTWKQVLCIFDCASWSMTQFPLNDALEAEFARRQITVLPEFFISARLGISGTGDVAYLHANVAGDDSMRRRHRYSVQLSVFEGNIRILNVTDFTNPGPAPASVFNVTTGDMYLIQQNDVTIIDCKTGSVRTGTSAQAFNAYRPVVSARSGEIAGPGAGKALALFRLYDGRLTTVMETVEQLQVRYPDVRPYGNLHSSAQWYTVSPDGEWIVFIAAHELDDGLFIIRRDGTELRRIARGIFDVPPVVSDVVPY